ncbi:MAG: site-specific integrase [Alphaproteobacteria bacterium]
MRRGEILRVEKGHFDRKKSTLIIPEAKNGHKRTIPLTPEAKKILEVSPSDERFVFPVHIKAIEYHWKRICEAASITGLHFHDLRHEAISSFFEMGLSIPEVTLISGHKDFRMLFRYTHMRAENIAKKFWRGIKAC